ncbi:sulfotransferase [Neobacillus sp. C211]|uniref:sulfotransferase n=1 Tax=unclassified Neobacillus TaxID=2675272 RepID=UPI003979C53B
MRAQSGESGNGGIDLVISAASLRSGSTLLQRIFNARRNTLIWGEHRGCLTDFCHIYKNILGASNKWGETREEFFGNGENPNIWVATMVPSPKYIEEAILRSVKTFLNSLYQENNEGHDIVGFKEVRYGRDELNLFRKCYPDAQIILLIRNPIHSWESYPKDWEDYRSADHFAEQWNKNVSFYLEFAQTDTSTHLIQYEKLVEKEPSTIKLISELGQLTDEEIDYVLSNKISGTNQQKSINNDAIKMINDICKKNMEQLEYL